MAALTPAVAEILPDRNGVIINGIAGGTIDAGQPVYLSPTNTYVACDANASMAAANAVGIALHAAFAGQPLKIQHSGDLILGATAAPAVGTLYVVGGALAGDIAPSTDLVSGWYTTVLGIGVAGNKLRLGIMASNVLVP